MFRGAIALGPCGEGRKEGSKPLAFHHGRARVSSGMPTGMPSGTGAIEQAGTGGDHSSIRITVVHDCKLHAPRGRGFSGSSQRLANGGAGLHRFCRFLTCGGEKDGTGHQGKTMGVSFPQNVVTVRASGLLQVTLPP